MLCVPLFPQVIDLLVDAIWNSPFETVIERVYMNGIGVQMSFASSTWFGEPVYMFMQGTQVPSTKAPPVKDVSCQLFSLTAMLLFPVTHMPSLVLTTPLLVLSGYPQVRVLHSTVGGPCPLLEGAGRVSRPVL